ncbi:MAG: hypothetical protein WB715_23535, partial [Roseiarcus sp.]
IAAIAAAHRRAGVTGFLPTVVTDAPRVLTQALAAAREAERRVPGALGAEQVALVGGAGEALRPYLEPEVVALLKPPLHDATDGAILMAGGVIAPLREAAQ